MDLEENRLEARRKGLSYARWAGRALGLVLIVMGFFSFLERDGGFATFKGAYFVLYGAILLVPYERLSQSGWKPCFTALAVFSGLFVFVMVAHVMFAYMAAAEIGEKLGVPGLEGTLIFVALMQVPVVLFQRNPDLLD